MKLRSLLFVPGDSEKRFARACLSGADVLILDLEDAVAPGMKDAARELHELASRVRSVVQLGPNTRAASRRLLPSINTKRRAAA